MNTSKEYLTEQIKRYALELGFDACGACKAEPAEEQKLHLQNWLKKSYQAGMGYLENNFDKRCDPTLLVEGAKSIISVALNYYPSRKQAASNPQFAYYAYGKDYHDVMKQKLQQLFSFIQTLVDDVSGRCFCDTAPVLERYWAAKAGLGFIGKNTLLIIPKKGSYFFLGEIILDLELEYDKPSTLSCGTCTRCLQACPTEAFPKPYILNSNKCISYQTIENKGDILLDIAPLIGNSNYIYGCDICQQVCPWNRFALAHNTNEFDPSEEFLALTADNLETMTETDYQRIFKGSAVKRAKYGGLMRNLSVLKNAPKPK